MGMYASYETATEHVYFYLENKTTGELSPFRGEHIGTNYYNGSSSESITESPEVTVGGEKTYPGLLNYHEITYWNTQVQDRANEVLNIGAVPNDDVEMTHKGNIGPPISELLALPGELSLNKNYASVYYHCL
jgi:hypothetical protein